MGERTWVKGELHAVTGAYGYSGRYIARRLLAEGVRVRTLTNSVPVSDPFAGAVERFPLCFERPLQLAEQLRGVRVLYNTYWVRFNHRRFGFAEAVRNTLALFDAARSAGVERIVHVSITNPSRDSPLEYFRGKAELELALAQSGISHAILRPTVLFGREDILINNIAWMLRRFPVFGVFGDGEYRLQPMYVDDLAALALAQGAAGGNATVNAIGPETFTYRELVGMIGRAIGHPRPVVAMPPALALAFATAMGWALRDVLITREEIQGLMMGLLHVDAPPAGSKRLSDWAVAHGATLGTRYASELGRRTARGGA